MYCTSLFNTVFCLLPFGNMHGELVARGGGGGGGAAALVATVTF